MIVIKQVQSKYKIIVTCNSYSNKTLILPLCCIISKFEQAVSYDYGEKEVPNVFRGLIFHCISILSFFKCAEREFTMNTTVPVC